MQWKFWRHWRRRANPPALSNPAAAPAPWNAAAASAAAVREMLGLQQLIGNQGVLRILSGGNRSVGGGAASSPAAGD
jgi:hypothetical protein